MQLSLPHDDKLAVLFRHHAVKNEGKSKIEGRPIFDDVEVVEIRPPGSRNTYVFPSTSISHSAGDGMYGTDESKVTYAERFSRQYRQFKEQQAQTITGTPLQHAPFLTEARRAEMRALSIYTVEQLAHIDGIELKNLGQGGRELKNAALDYIETSKANVGNITMQHELDQLRARNQVLEDDLKSVKTTQSVDLQFDDMNDEQLREYIGSRAGASPKGDVPRKTLLRMAREATPRAA